MAFKLGRRVWLGICFQKGRRILGLMCVVTLLEGPFGVIASAQSGSAPRTPWGHPDLRGIWDYRTTTPLERPEESGQEIVLAGDAAQRFVQQRRQADAQRLLNADWNDRLDVGLADGRTALIVDPPNGRRPPLTREAEQRSSAWNARWTAAHSHRDLDFTDRCIMRQSPPMGIHGYNNNLLLLQTPDTIAILHEMIHDTILIPLDGRPPIDDGIRLWLGSSRGHWEGDTLVVETTHRHPQWSFPRFQAPTPNLHVVERFTRVNVDTLRYEYTVTDPETFTAPWSVEFPMRRTDQPLYEFACHEGNYSLPNILAGRRAIEAEDPGR